MSSSEPCHPVSVPQKPRIIYAGEPKDYTLWDNNQDILRRLYLAQNSSLKDVKRRMETEHQFPVLPLKEYETVLRDHFQFRKKVGRSDWGPIGYRIEKRRLAGKNSKVYLGPKLLPPHSVAREVRRYSTKDQISSRIRQGLSPRLPENIIIRTPSPQPTQHLETMSLHHTLNTYGSNLVNNTSEYATRVSRDFFILDITAMADQYTRIEAINAIRLRSPFNGFLTLLQKLTSPTPADRLSGIGSGPSSYRALVKTATSSHTTQPSPPRFQTESLGALSVPNVEVLSDPSQLVFPGSSILPAMLAQACFAVSNGSDWSSTFTKDLFRWIEISADPADLRNFFSIESYTVMAIWENLVDSSILMCYEDVFEVLVESALSTGRDQWIRRRSGDILCAAVEFGKQDTVHHLLALGIPPDSLGQTGGVYMRTPLQNAIRSFDQDMMRLLYQSGADFKLQPVWPEGGRYELWSGAPLIALIDSMDEASDCDALPEADVIIDCAHTLLDRGAQIDVCRNSGGKHNCTYSPEAGDLGPLVKEWFGSEGPQWCTDYAFHRFPYDETLAHLLLERSSRAHTQVTVPGIIAQAPKGLENLRTYLRERRFPLRAQVRIALLEIALCWAVKRENLDAVTHLLQLGVDLNVGTISCFLGVTSMHYWHPVHRALWRGHDLLLSILRDYGNNVTNNWRITYEIISSALSDHAHNRLQSVKLSGSDIETHGKELLWLFLSTADQRNFPVCTRMCEVLWSKNVPMDIKWDGGRCSLHLAISQNCCVDMCKFLVARGYKVHSYPTEGVLMSGSSYPTTMLGDAIKHLGSHQHDLAMGVIDFLLEHGASMEFPPESPTLLESVLDSRYYGLNSGLQEVIEKFMALGASVDVPPRKHSTPLWLSVLCKLISSGATDDFIFRVINASEDIDQQGDPLAMALRHGRFAVAESLLLRGAKVNHPPRACSWGRFPAAGRRGPVFQGALSAACSPVSSIDVQEVSTHVRFVERLITLGADVSGSAELYMKSPTPLQYAASAGLIDVACLLMKHGADVNALVTGIVEPMRALDYAAEQGRLDMVQLLRGVGGISGDPGETGVDKAIRCAEKERHYSVSDFLRSTIDRIDI